MAAGRSALSTDRGSRVVTPIDCWSAPNHDFAEMDTALKVAVGLRRFVEIEAAMDHRPQAVALNHRVHLFEHRPQTDVDPVQTRTSAHQQVWIDVAAASRQDADEQDTTAEAEGLHRAVE